MKEFVFGFRQSGIIDLNKNCKVIGVSKLRGTDIVILGDLVILSDEANFGMTVDGKDYYLITTKMILDYDGLLKDEASISRRITKLKKYGLVETKRGGWIRVTEKTLKLTE
ncbi:MAG: hypothetical protein ACRCX8_05795 [Sarcina sp.]